MKSDYKIYWLIDKVKNKTYIGYSNNIERRFKEHKSHNTFTTKNFEDFKMCILETVDNIEKAKIREKYWKSHTGRKRLKKLFENL